MDGIKKINENVISPYRSLTITGNNLPDNRNWQNGTLKCDPTTAGLTFKVADNTFSLFDATKTLQPNTVTTELIKDETIQTVDLSDECVINSKIGTRTIHHTKLMYQTLTADEYANGSVVNRVLADQSVNDRVLADHSILERHFSNACVSNRCMQNDSISALNLMDSAVLETKLANDSVSAHKIMNGAVTYEKIQPYAIIGGETNIVNGKAVQGRIAKGTITNYNLADYTITSINIMNGAVENRCLADFSIDDTKIKPKSIVNTCLADKTITSTQIGDEAIKTINYANKSITKDKLSDDVYDAVNNAVIYNEEGNVVMLKNPTKCAVEIGSSDSNGTSNKNGSLVVYGDIRADRVYNMAYSDLAEGYIPGEELKPGDIVEYREDGKVYKAEHGVPGVVVGVVSDEYATCFGASKEELESGEKVAVGLLGKIHVNVLGPTKIGKPLSVSYKEKGVGEELGYGYTVGKILETTQEKGMHKVLCLINLS